MDEQNVKLKEWEQRYESYRHYRSQYLTTVSTADLPPIVVPFLTRVLEPWTMGEAERSPEAMALLFQGLGGGSPVNCAA